MAIVVIIAMILLILGIVCAFKESKITGLYKSFGVYGRLKAYLALDFTLCGIMLVVSSVVGSLFSTDIVSTGMSPYLGVLLGIALFALGYLIYWRTYSKCPPELRSKCIRSMIITGVGISVKISFFFLLFIWKLYEPQRYVTSDGSEVYVYGGTAYNPVTGKYGSFDGDTVYWNS